MTQTNPAHSALVAAGGTTVLRAGGADVGASREASRRRRLWRLAAMAGVPTAYLWYRLLDGRPFNVFALPHIDWLIAGPFLFFALLIVLLAGTQLVSGRSPHVTYRPEQIDVRLADVRGIDPVKEDVVRSLNLFLAHKTFASEMGGTPRRGLLFEGSPGTGKTYLAKKLANALAGGDASRSTVVQFHPAMSYEDFVQGLRPEETPSGAVMYRLRDGHLMRMVKRADANPDQRHVMVIDEINRANLPKVLGELLFLLEYRDDAIPLLYEPDAAFRLPKNLWFIGTMNTADRSIALIDAALRRRFHFVPFFPTQPPIEGVLEQFLEDNGFSTAPAAFLRAVNADLLTKQNVDEHVLIGPSHFMNPNHYVDGALPEPIVERIWTYNVFPLIEELLWGQNAEIEQWRWPKTRTRYTTQLGITLPPTEPADAADAEAVAPEG